MSDIVPFKRLFRRKKRHQGATWTPEKQSADTTDGLWCPVHRIRHGYSRMAISYEKGSNGRWKILWSCRLTGNVLGEQSL